jgi:hypothetical protein
MHWQMSCVKASAEPVQVVKPLQNMPPALAQFADPAI